MSIKGKWKDFSTGIFFIAFGIALFLSALTIPAGGQLSMGGDFMPKVMSVLLILCGAAFAGRALFAKPEPAADDGGSLERSPEQKAEKRRQRIMFLLEFGLLFLYLMLLKPVGFLITTTVYIFLQMWLITPSSEKRRPVVMAVVAVAATLFTYFVFVKGFRLLLPAGILG